MKEQSQRIQDQVKELQVQLEFMKKREIEYRKLQAEIFELRAYLDKVRLFMLRLSQGHFPFEIMAEHLGHKLDKRSHDRNRMKLLS
jgi:hypothetical protein